MINQPLKALAWETRNEVANFTFKTACATGASTMLYGDLKLGAAYGIATSVVSLISSSEINKDNDNDNDNNRLLRTAGMIVKHVVTVFIEASLLKTQYDETITFSKTATLSFATEATLFLFLFFLPKRKENALANSH